MSAFTASGNQFFLDGKPFQILSGAMHYFRVLPAYWEDRLQKLRAMGLNTVETYVAWNLHEPSPGEFHFEGRLDLRRYVEICHGLGFRVILRPGPYICSEWDLGGLPPWLLADPGMRLRCLHRPYVDAVDRFFDALLPPLVSLQVSQGGPIIAVQVENEYGSFGNDRRYLEYLAEGLRRRGVDALLFTSDGPTDEMLQYGTVPGILKTVNFGSKAKEAFDKLSEYQHEGPAMCGEFWNGWFDHWGEDHHQRSPEDAAAALDEILSLGASVNLYMAHGGTNFGFMNGANSHSGKYEPTITSYDDDAPLDEAGDPTPKYWAFREILGKYGPLPDDEPPGPTPKSAFGEVLLDRSVSLFDALPALVLGEAVDVAAPATMESFGQSYGFILYRGHVSGPRQEAPLSLEGLQDRAHVLVNGKLMGIVEREFPERQLALSVSQGGATLDILVENMGRSNYGPGLERERKGITGVRLGLQHLFGWTVYPLPMADLSGLDMREEDALEGLRFYEGSFHVDTPGDTFLSLPGWTKGVCWLNGFNLGRYWRRGPQQTLYVPGVLLKQGPNRIIVLELDGTTVRTVVFQDKPNLGA